MWVPCSPVFVLIHRARIIGTILYYIDELHDDEEPFFISDAARTPIYMQLLFFG